jgi:two-component system sensor histidine kinase KdpD
MTSEEELIGDPLIEGHHISIIKRMIKDRVNGGAFEIIHRELGYKVLIVQSKSKVYGALCIDCMEQDIDRDDLDFTKTVLLLLSNVLEREFSILVEQTSRLEYEKERFKTMMLRSISHDLRTPLTTLQTGLSFIEQSYEDIDDQTKKDMIKDIYNETSHLSDFVENILYMTRLNAKDHVLHISSELVEDLFNNVKERVYQRLGQHQLIFDETSDEMIEVDGQLIIQTLTNLIENAIKHTRLNSTIHVHFNRFNKTILFEVSDDGGGISDDQLDIIFNDYTSIQHTVGDKKRGVGLGLSICKMIVEAHGGWIQALNNHEGGATFRFELPIKKGDQDEQSGS